MLIARYEFTPSAKGKDQFLQTLRRISTAARNKPGCIGSFIYQDILEPYSVSLFEYWESRRLLDWHLRSEQFRRLLALMEMSALRPNVVFLEASDVGGIDLIREALEPRE